MSYFAFEAESCQIRRSCINVSLHHAASQIQGWVVVLSNQTFVSHLLMADVFYNTIFQIRECTYKIFTKYTPQS